MNSVCTKVNYRKHNFFLISIYLHQTEDLDVKLEYLQSVHDNLKHKPIFILSNTKSSRKRRCNIYV